MFEAGRFVEPDLLYPPILSCYITLQITYFFPQNPLKSTKCVKVITLATMALWQHIHGDDLAPYTSIGLKYHAPWDVMRGFILQSLSCFIMAATQV